MRYDFDTIIDRTGSGDLKHCVLGERYGRSDLLPLWVADMDFATPSFIIDALRKRLEHPILGYTITPPELWQVVSQWIEHQHGWHTNEKWYTFIPGVVKGIGIAINLFVAPDEKVIIQPPVYHPFRLTPQGNGRKVVYNPLRQLSDGSYEMDFENLAQVADDKCRLLILSNPHNPAGICWDRETLRRLAHFCAERNIIVVSDEIHSDLALFGNKHVPFASVSDEAARCSITLGAPSKTFNIAGVISSYAIVPNELLRRKFFSWLDVNELSEPHLFAPIATIAAYTQGAEWLQQLKEYLADNIRFVEQYCRLYIPSIKPVRPQASFLVWLDCRNLYLNQLQIVDLFVNKAHLALNDGAMFGAEGEGFMRINIGAPRAILAEALTRLSMAVEERWAEESLLVAI